MRSNVNRSQIEKMPGISSERVILVEGDAGELVPGAKLKADMHGFVVMVPPGDEGERLLDMLWRITMAYAARPSMLASRTMMRKMIEAVWSKESREPKPGRKSELADLTRRDRIALVEAIIRTPPKPNAKLRRAIASFKKNLEGSKTKARK